MRGLRTFCLVATLAVAQVALARSEGIIATTFRPPSDTVTPSGGAAVRKQESARPRGTATFDALQMNLCNSGIAGCYTGRAAAKATQIVLERVPALVAVNEACESDVTDRLLPAMLSLYPNEWVFWTFAPAAHRGTDEPVLCTPDAQGRQRGRFGNGAVGRLFTSASPRFTFDGGLFPDDRPSPDELQDRAHAEMRSWVCAAANDVYRACAAHLDNPSATGAGTPDQARVAYNQCRHLLKTVAEGRPTVVLGDLNMGADPSARYSVDGCVPAGWSRHGDGAVQHALAGNGFGTATVAVVPMGDTTDHPALLVSFRTQDFGRSVPHWTPDPKRQVGTHDRAPRDRTAASDPAGCGPRGQRLHRHRLHRGEQQGRHAAGPAVSWVAADYAAATQMVVDRLHALGHRNLLLVAGGRTHETVVERRSGFAAARKRHRLGDHGDRQTCSPPTRP